MRILLLILYALGALASCQGQQGTSQTMQGVLYSEQTRGRVFEIRVSADSIRVLAQGVENFKKAAALTPTQMETLRILIADIPPEDLPALETSTENSATDRGPFAQVTLFSEERTYSSPYFDVDNPPVALQSTIRYLRELGDSLE
ncbi:MAG: hypothetical protein R3252_06455 [Robiginitalea sp.]|nr:hypothetical protein [Robiginitalea sp.]